MEQYNVIGVMSGTSLDGVDLAYCRFKWTGKWEFTIEKAQTIPYNSRWLQKIIAWYKTDRNQLAGADVEYGTYLARVINKFIESNNFRPDFIASHGHTIMHQPSRGFTVQIGRGQTIADIVQLPVVSDFRSADVAKGGQGAPLVPVGDHLLFKAYDYCINLGGFSNISFEHEGKRVAYDICPVNIVLNSLSQKAGFPYDEGGKLARSGKLIDSLFNQLNQLDYYQQPFPKSLGREWVESAVDPILFKNKHAIIDLLSTFTSHAAYQIARSMNQATGAKVLLTGGGALNKYLVDLIQFKSKHNVVVPHHDLINYKEALVFAFLGVLKMRNEINCYASVTGAISDTSAGVVSMPKKK